jgi:hypothetical protein
VSVGGLVGRGRATAAAIVACYFGFLAAVGGYNSWSRLGVFPIGGHPYWFGDLRNVTSGWECLRRGLPLVPVNPCDAWQRPTVYPHVWLLPRYLGLGQGDTVALGLALVGVFLLAALAVLPRATGMLEGALYGLAVCSAAVMLGIQRGNVDLLLFALLTFAALVAPRAIVSGALVFLAAVLKLYPIFAVGFLLRRPTRRNWTVAGVVLAGFTVYAVGTLDTIREIRKAVPEVDTTSFGLRRFSDWLAARVAGHSSPAGWDVAIVLVAFAAAFLLRRGLRRQLPQENDRTLDLFWVGACVYIGSYALYRSFDYRLAFVLMCLPQLLQWAREGSAVAFVSVVALFGALWLDTPWTGVPVLGWLAHSHVVSLQPAVASQLLLFFGLVAAVVATAPTSVPFRPTRSARSRQEVLPSPIEIG